MTKQFIKDSFGFGSLLWLIGYILGFVFFPFVPPALIGWYIMPIGIVLTLFVSFKFIKASSVLYYFKVGLIWTLTAVVFDYFFLLQLLKPADGYYKMDVYLYYVLTLALPIMVGWYKGANAVK